MNLIFKTLNNILSLIRNTVSMFLPINNTSPTTEATPSENITNKDIYPHKHMTTSTATKSYYIFTEDSYPKSYLYDQKKQSPYSSVKVKNNYNRAVDSRSDIAIMRLRKAVFNKGINPKFHDKLMKKHRSEWPELWVAIDALLKADE